MKRRIVVAGVGCLIVGAFLAGCTTSRATPVEPRSVGSLTPTHHDEDAGLVEIVPGFNLRQYQAIIVEPFVVSPAEIKDEEDVRLANAMSRYLHAQFVGRLKLDPPLPKIIDATASAEPFVAQGALILQGDISRLTAGSQALRYFVGFGAGSVKVQVETRLIDGNSREVKMVTADRRVAKNGPFGGDSRVFFVGFSNLIAQGYVDLLHRLALTSPSR